MSGQQTGANYFTLVLDFLETSPTFPLLPDGTVSITEVARLTGVPKQSLYKNPGIRRLLQQALDDRGLKTRGHHQETSDSPVILSQGEAVPTPKQRINELRIHRLEQQNASLVAENAELRWQITTLKLQLGRDDMIIESGRRIVSVELALR